jgi:hypothetical protein
MLVLDSEGFALLTCSAGLALFGLAQASLKILDVMTSQAARHG